MGGVKQNERSTPMAVSMSKRAGVRPKPWRTWRPTRTQPWKARLQPKKIAFMVGSWTYAVQGGSRVSEAAARSVPAGGMSAEIRRA